MAAKIIDKGMADLVLAVQDLEGGEERLEATVSGLRDRIQELLTPATDPDTTRSINDLLKDIANHKAALLDAVNTGEAVLPVVTANGLPFDGTNGTPEQNADFARGRASVVPDAPPDPVADDSTNSAFQAGVTAATAEQAADPATGAVKFNGTNGTDAENADYARGVSDAQNSATMATSDQTNAAYQAGFASVVPTSATRSTTAGFGTGLASDNASSAA